MSGTAERRTQVVVWVVEGTWPACVDAAADLLGTSGGTASSAAHADREWDVLFVHVLEDVPLDIGEGARAGLFGRGRRRDASPEMSRVSVEAAEDLVRRAQERFAARAGGHDVRTSVEVRRGRIEREVTAACAQAHYLVLGRDGDLSRLGPHSLGRHARFVVDHAPCRVVLVWPEPAPDLTSIPPPPPEPPRP